MTCEGSWSVPRFIFSPNAFSLMYFLRLLKGPYEIYSKRVTQGDLFDDSLDAAGTRGSRGIALLTYVTSSTYHRLFHSLMLC